jgi:hypothetical protein
LSQDPKTKSLAASRTGAVIEEKIVEDKHINAGKFAEQ